MCPQNQGLGPELSGLFGCLTAARLLNSVSASVESGLGDFSKLFWTACAVTESRAPCEELQPP